MATTARELLLILRGRNEMSGATRSAAADVAALNTIAKKAQENQIRFQKQIADGGPALAAQEKLIGAQQKYNDMLEAYGGKRAILTDAQNKALSNQVDNINKANRAYAEQLALLTAVEEKAREVSDTGGGADRSFIDNIWSLALGHGGKGSSGIWLPLLMMGGRGGFGRRFGRGLPAFGSLLALAGFGAERVLTSSLGVAGSIGGAAIGAGLYGLGIAAPLAVGAGTNLAGIGQAAGDIKKVSTDLGALSTAVTQYGRSSQQAIQAQQQLNADLKSFSPVARNAVLAAAKTSQGFKAMFDKLTGPAEKTGANIINQAMGVGEKFLPTIGKFAAQNMKIIQAGLQPLFGWLQGAGKTQGLGIFTQLEQTFQNRLPTAVHAGTQAFEVFLNLANDASKRTGGFLTTLNKFFTKLNTPQGLTKMNQEVGKLMSLFHAWFGLLASGAHLLFDLFKPAVGFGKDFAVQLTHLLDGTRKWVDSINGANGVLRTLFTAHVDQFNAMFGIIKALGPGIAAIATAFIRVEAAIAGGTVPAFRAFAQIVSVTIVPALKIVAYIMTEITKVKIIGTLLGMGAAFLILRKAMIFTFGGMVKLVQGILRFLGLMGPETTAEASVMEEALTPVVGLLESIKVQLAQIAALLADESGMAALGGVAAEANVATTSLTATTGAAIGLRTALMGIAAIGVITVAVILERKKIEGDVRNLFGSTLAKEINATTGLPKGLSFGQKLGNIFGSSFSEGVHAMFGSGIKNFLNLGIDKTLNDAKSGIDRVSLTYRNWLHIIQRPGSPQALNAFLQAFHRAALTGQSSGRDIAEWLQNVNRAAVGVTNIKSLNKELVALAHNQYLLAHQNPMKDFNNRLSQAVTHMRDLRQAAQQAKNSIANMLQNATQNGVVATKTFKQLYDALVNAQKATALDPTSYAKQKAVVDAQAALQAQVSSQQAAAAQAAANATTSKFKQANTQIAAQAKETFASVLSSIQGMYSSFLSTEQSIMGTLFAGPFMSSPRMQNFLQWGGKATGKDLLKDLKSQVFQFNEFHRDLNRLSREGAPLALVQQIEALGPSALPQLRALLHLHGGLLNEYFSEFRRAQRLIQKQALADLNAQLDQYKKFGRNVALAIVSGVESQNKAVTNALKKMIREAFPGLPGSGTVSGGGGSGGGTHHHHHHHHHHQTTYNVSHPGHGASIATQVRHADFVRRNKQRSRHNHP